MKGLNLMKKMLICAIGCIGLVQISWAASASECSEASLSTEQKMQIKSFVKNAQSVAQQKGIMEASKEFMTPKFIRENLYIFVINHNQYSLANGGKPDFVGKDLKNVEEARESAQKIINKAKQGGGWVSYLWTSPKTHNVECKTSWVTPLIKDSKSDQSYTIGAGVEH